MKQLKLEKPPIYRDDPWLITEDSFSLSHNLLSETIFALGNGYIGMRGNLEEGLPGIEKEAINGIYLNGFYESVPIPHAERGYGYAVNTQTMLNVTNSKMIELYLCGERFDLLSGTVLDYRRTLDLKGGFLTRELTWRSKEGRKVRITIKKVVALAHRHLALFQYRVEPLNFSGEIEIRSSLDGNVDNHTHAEEDPRFSATLGGLGLFTTAIETTQTGAVITQQTRRSALTMACAMDHALVEGNFHEPASESSSDRATLLFRFEGQQSKRITLEKYVSYYTSRDYPPRDLGDLATAEVRKAKKTGFEQLLSEQAAYAQSYWDKVAVSIEGDQSADQGLRFNLFHLLQAAGSDGKTGIGAKGLSSEGYDGHYFWDTEIYLIPFYAAVLPDQARNLLLFRYSILDHARSRARELSHPRGALYPWRTIAGEEGSSYYPAGTAQYHINAAIAYAFKKYEEVTGDYAFIVEYGAEVIFETARLWQDLGAYIPRKGNLFCFNEVTGPDEYTALVNNNCYTNLMAQWHLNYACAVADDLELNHAQAYRKLAAKIGLRAEEVEAWREAADRMLIPYDQELRIHPQDDSFLDKEKWNFAATPPEKYPLLLHYHPLVIYRYQVCKQPDIILAHLLLGDRFTREQKRRDYDFYEPITTHDSSLSPAIFSVVAAELGYFEDAGRFFEVSARLDLDNLLKDSQFGLHMANMAGSWLCLVYGFAGMRTTDGNLRFKPYLPHPWRGYGFNIIFRGRELTVKVEEKRVIYHLLHGEDLGFNHDQAAVNLAAGNKAVFPLTD